MAVLPGPLPPRGGGRGRKQRRDRGFLESPLCPRSFQTAECADSRRLLPMSKNLGCMFMHPKLSPSSEEGFKSHSLKPLRERAWAGASAKRSGEGSAGNRSPIKSTSQGLGCQHVLLYFYSTLLLFGRLPALRPRDGGRPESKKPPEKLNGVVTAGQGGIREGDSFSPATGQCGVANG